MLAAATATKHAPEAVNAVDDFPLEPEGQPKRWKPVILNDGWSHKKVVLLVDSLGDVMPRHCTYTGKRRKSRRISFFLVFRTAPCV